MKNLSVKNILAFALIVATFILFGSHSDAHASAVDGVEGVSYAMSAAVTLSGDAVETVKLKNSVKGQRKMVLRITSTAAEDAADIELKPGIWKGRADIATNDEGVAVSGSVTGYDSSAEWLRVMNAASVGIAGMRITSDDEANLDNTLYLTEMQPHGQKDTVDISLSEYREQSASGYSKTMYVPSSDFRILLWQFLDLQLATLKSGSYIEFEFYLKGWTGTRELCELGSSSIGR